MQCVLRDYITSYHLPITCSMIINPHLARAWASHLVTVDVVPPTYRYLVDDR